MIIRRGWGMWKTNGKGKSFRNAEGGEIPKWLWVGFRMASSGRRGKNGENKRAEENRKGGGERCPTLLWLNGRNRTRTAGMGEKRGKREEGENISDRAQE